MPIRESANLLDLRQFLYVQNSRNVQHDLPDDQSPAEQGVEKTLAIKRDDDGYVEGFVAEAIPKPSVDRRDVQSPREVAVEDVSHERHKAQ